ncbi:hypothetical protein J4050_14610 [Winogradskyella sp. DF17]|uniref:DUF4181 domain-containing protein n=1 Tax=Winogradskyella pelagia TaxID=2819984 RepID=A0ABS3T7W5_9FLAO|nr:hypothetical protein [Winogradskyella sp. DF17]MBO3117986.1 hypothetical protein [Winogradskyella sp. DF17]
MTFTIVFLTVITTFILFKIKTISERQQLNSKVEKRLFISGILLVLFIITNATLPYPESLYWFIVLGVLTVIGVLSFDVVKKELHRFKLLSLKDRVTNVAFYGLLITVTTLFI